MSLEIKGVVKTVGDVFTVGANNTAKREFVLSVQDGNYSNDVCFQTLKDKTTMCDRLKVGDTVTVHFNLQSNNVNGKYYTNATAWKIVF